MKPPRIIAEAGRARKGGKANARTAARRLLTVLAFPLLPFHLALRFLSPFRGLCGEDQRHTARCRRSEFRNTVLQFAYFILWLPEYRSVFYMRCGVAGRLLRFTPPLRPQTTLYIRTGSSRIGGGMVVHHGHSVEINAARIGRDFHCMQNVTVGSRGNPRARPVIGDNVFIGAGAVVLGDVRIGDNVKIGANATVLKDVPDGCTVVSGGACIVRLGGERVHVEL